MTPAEKTNTRPHWLPTSLGSPFEFRKPPGKEGGEITPP